MVKEWIPGTQQYSANVDRPAWLIDFKPEPVKKEHMPALRALIKSVYPNIAPHAMARLAALAQQHMGPTFTGGKLGVLTGEKVPTDGTVAAYSNAVSRLSKNENARDLVKYLQSIAIQETTEGAPGYTNGLGDKQAANGKLALSSRTIVAGTDFLDTTIRKKVDSNVNSDFFSYVAGPENGLYNSMYLNEKRWEKEIKYAEPLQLPRSGNDQLNLGFPLPEQYTNAQPIEEELVDRFETQLYSIYAANDHTHDTALRDKTLQYDPIMDRTYLSYLQPVITLKGDGEWPYKDPSQPMTPAEINFIGMRPSYDSFKEPFKPTRFEPITKTWSDYMQFRMAQELGAAGYMIPS